MTAILLYIIVQPVPCLNLNSKFIMCYFQGQSGEPGSPGARGPPGNPVSTIVLEI